MPGERPGTWFAPWVAFEAQSFPGDIAIVRARSAGRKGCLEPDGYFREMRVANVTNTKLWRQYLYDAFKPAAGLLHPASAGRAAHDVIKIGAFGWEMIEDFKY